MRVLPLLLCVLGCSSTAELQPRAVAPRPETDSEPVPAPGRYLHKKAMGGDRFQTADGLVTPAGLRETEEYYAAQLVGIRADAPYPRDLRAWKQTFGFPARAAGESLAAYRARANVAVYYNENELGLGRELACSVFTTERHGLRGQACYVTNYGQNFNDREGALRDAVAGVRVKNTVAILYNPELPPGSQVNFWTYGGAEIGDDGLAAYSAQLDYMGPRAVPQICTSCHGGTYDPETNLVRHGHFLPANVPELRFAPSAPLAEQMERFRIISELALATPLTSAQIAFIDGTFGGRVAVPGEPARRFVPPAFRGGVPSSDGTLHSAEDLYRIVLGPHCNGCHDALQGEPGARDFSDPRSLVDDSALVDDVCDAAGRAAPGNGSDAQWVAAQPALAEACGHCHTWDDDRVAVDAAAGSIHQRVAAGVMPRRPFALTPEQRTAILEYTAGADAGPATLGYGYTMPNAQPTQRRFWGRPVVDGRGVHFRSAKSYLMGYWLAGVGARCGPKGCDCGPSRCDDRNARSGTSGAALCGDPVSGTACSAESGRCVDEASHPGGACDPEHGRMCPAHEECSAGSCLKCGRSGEVPCPLRGCEPGLVAPDGVCAH
jgi:hypothetical protein